MTLMPTPAPVIHSIAGATYHSDEIPGNLAAACDAVLFARVTDKIPSLAILREWHRLLPGNCALLGSGNPQGVAHWAYRQFWRAASHDLRAWTDILIAGGLHRIALEPNADGENSLLHAVVGCRCGAYALNVLLKAGLDVETTGYENETVLHRAAAHGYAEHVSVLLDWEADVQSPNDELWTPLHQAATSEAQNLAVIEVLVAAGADLNALTLGDETPVQLAWKTGHESHAPFLERLARSARRLPA
jgi:hypothetical protein